MVILSCEGIAAGYGKTDILRDVDLRIRAGENVGIVGPNGSGKTTLMRVIARMLPVRRGRVALADRDVRSIPGAEFSKTVSFLPSALEINYPYTVREFVEMARYPFSGIIRRERAHDSEVLADTVRSFQISDLLDRTVSALSEGEKQRVYLAQCLVQEPRLLLLDEPTSHLDIGHQFSFLDMLRKTQKEKGTTVLSIFHDLNLASQYCDTIVLLHEGRIAAAGTPAEVLTYENIERVYRTAVLVYPHPVSGKPYVFGIPAEWKEKQLSS